MRGITGPEWLILIAILLILAAVIVPGLMSC